MTVRDLVFVSYAHEDRKWLRDLRTFLKPYERQGRLEVWADPYIPVGSDWHREITDALARTSVGVALVTQDFVASDFIVEQELPAMRRAADAGEAVIVAVPVSAATHDALGLDDLQWARPPEKPLDALRKAKRNQALVEIAHIIRDAAAAGAEEVEEAVVPPVAARRVGPVAVTARVEPGDALGALHGVPAQRPNFVPRLDDRVRVVDALLGESFAVGVTGARRVGVHGMGGIGKSVLAIDVVHQDAVRRAFPDGVFWVTLGQAPKVLDLQAGLVRQVTGAEAAVSSVHDGVETLRAAFADRRALLVLDDVWSAKQAGPFDVLGAGSRLLLTTRDRGVVGDVGAQEERLDVLSTEAARILLAEWVGVEPSELPVAADELIDEAGHLPLAISVTGALIADGADWSEVVGQLRAGRLDYLDHPYGNVFASMQLGLDALDDDDRQRLLELAVFPDDEHVPRSVIERLWATTGAVAPAAAAELLDRFDQRALLYVDPADGGVSLHDLQHDFLRLEADDVETTHAALVEAYWPVGAELPTIPGDERYVWERLGYHLAEAGAVDRWRDLLLDPAWMRVKLLATDIAALLEDYDADPIDESVALVGAALRKSAHVIGGDPTQLPGQLLGRLSHFDSEPVTELCAGVDRAASAPWLRPLTPSLQPPGVGEVLTLLGHVGSVAAVAITPDGQRAITAGNDLTARLWDLTTGEQLAQLDGHTGSLTAVAITPDGERAITTGIDHTARVWDLTTRQQLAQLDGHTDSVTGVAITPDGHRAITTSEDGTARLWDLTTGTQTAELDGHTGLDPTVAITPDGQRAITTGWGTARVCDLTTGEQLALLDGHTDSVNAVAITPDGRRAITTSDDHTARLWDLTTSRQLAQLDGHTRRVTAVAITPDGQRAITTSGDGTARLWDLTTSRQLAQLDGHTDSVAALAITPDGQRAITTSTVLWQHTADLWDLAAGAHLARLHGHTGPVTAVAITPDGQRAITTSWDCTARLWDVVTGDQLAQLDGHTESVTAVAITPDSQRAITASGDGTARLWDLTTSRQLAQLDDLGHTPWFAAAVAITANGERAIISGGDGTARLWDLTTGAQLARLDGHTSRITAVAIAPDGQRAITTTRNGTARLWDLTTGEQLAQLDGHTDSVNAVAIAPDGQRAITVSDDRTARLWDLTTGERLACFTGEGAFLAVAVGPCIVAGDQHGRIHLLAFEAALGANSRASPTQRAGPQPSGSGT